tara:strand:- start:1852 stop:2250 length:399 start_codon:yes stop_codon:yes gene_type:complete
MQRVNSINYKITMAEKLYLECWDDVYLESMIHNLDSDWTAYNTKDEIDCFWDNITTKKVGKGTQMIFAINNLADCDLMDQILMDCDSYTQTHLEESLSGNDMHYSPSVHRKHREILKEKFAELKQIKLELTQ